MRRISIVGAKNAGKTTLIEKLLDYFKSQNLKSVTIKHTSHSHYFDKPGKDTFRHRTAGAVSTIAIGPESFALFGVPNSSVKQKIINVVLESVDICLIEGDKFSDVKKIVITREIENLDINEISNIICSYGGGNLDEGIKHFNNDEENRLGEFILSISDD